MSVLFQYKLFGWSGALTFGYGCIVYVGVDVIYISFIVSIQHIGYLNPYKDKGYKDKWTTEPPCTVLDRII